MKLSVFALAAVSTVSAEKKVPNRTPLQRLKTLKRFAGEWTAANLDENNAALYATKLQKHADRMATKFNRCGFFDPTVLPHGGPKPEARKRRAAEDNDASIMDCEEGTGLCPRYDQKNPIRGLQQIIKGYQKWCTRYIAECGTNRTPPRDPTPAEILVVKFSNFQSEMLDLLPKAQ